MTIGDVVTKLIGDDAPFSVTAYDGSVGGNPDAPYGVHIENERGIRYLISHPGELGLARAYVSGDLTLSGVDPVSYTHLLAHDTKCDIAYAYF